MLQNARRASKQDREKDGGSGGAPPREASIALSEDALALEFTQRHAGDLLHVASQKRWLYWDGQRFHYDETQYARRLARKLCREAATRCDNDHAAKKIASAKTVYAVERLASTDKQHAVVAEDFDADPWELNTPDGIVDLRTGNVQPHDRAKRHTKMTVCGVADECPTWEMYLDDVTGGDLELSGYLQRVAGYCLTGSIVEHAMFFAYGPGGNGKSIFINTLGEILGDYATTAPMDLFCVSRGERHPTEFALLRGARLIRASETEEGRRWDEARLKSITGGDKISARFIRGDFFEFSPCFKLLIAGNYKPAMRSVDDAMKRRINVLPFLTRVANPDKNLPAKLRNEYAGILGWAIKGCLEWQKIGLAPPAAVVRATADYFETEDTFGRWIEDRCEQGPNCKAYTRELFDDWKKFAKSNEEFIGNMRRFSQLLEHRGFTKWRHPESRARGFAGLALKEAPDELQFGDRSLGAASPYGDGREN